VPGVGMDVLMLQVKEEIVGSVGKRFLATGIQQPLFNWCSRGMLQVTSVFYARGPWNSANTRHYFMCCSMDLQCIWVVMHNQRKPLAETRLLLYLPGEKM
jgi:hypothetical protein